MKSEVLKCFFVWTALLTAPLFIKLILNFKVFDWYYLLLTFLVIPWYIVSGRMKESKPKILKDPAIIGGFLSLAFFGLLLILFQSFVRGLLK